MDQSISERIKEAKGKLAREFTIADSYEVEKDLTVLKCRGISLKVFDLLAEALESEPAPEEIETGDEEVVEVERGDLKLGDEVWVRAKVIDDCINGLRVGISHALNIVVIPLYEDMRKLIRKKEKNDER